MRKIVLRVTFATLIISALIAITLYWALRSSLPEYTAVFTVQGPAQEIKIIRDEHAVPHIFAQSEDDAFFALGFLHAQDRLWQLDTNRRIASGRLAESLGEGGLSTDVFLRTLGVYRAAQSAWEHADQATRTMLEAYSAGVNAFAENHNGLLPPEFLITRSNFEPWTPVDSLAWLKMMAWDLGGNWRDELARLDMIARLGPKRAAEFMPAYPGEPPRVFPELNTLYPGVVLPAQRGEKDSSADHAAINLQPRKWVGSNNWVVNGSWTKTGKPLLANDPHLGLTTPSIWYLVHINVQGHNMVGSTLPGVPFIVLGRNDRIAWGFTNTGPDVQDLYIERLSDDSGLSYETETGPRTFLIREEVIKVKGQDDVVIRVRESRHGPIISDASEDIKGLIDTNHVMAFRWTALEEKDGSASAGRQIYDASNWTDLRQALMGFHAPEQNIVYADIDGNIGYIAPGKVPIRHSDSPTHGLLPARGWLGTDEWIGQIPYDELPQSYNPPSGMVHTANQKVVRDDYPHHITDDWALPYRANRIEAELAKTARHDFASFAKLQMDPVSDMITDMRAVMLSIGDFNGKHEDIRRALSEWDGAMARDLAEPLIYAAWHRAVAKRIYADDLGERFERYWHIRPDFLLPLFHGAPHAKHWCNDILTNEEESCSSQVAQALDDAIEELNTIYGKNWQTWRWGDAHKVVQTHRPFSNIGPLKKFFELKDEADGGPLAVNVSPLRFSSDKPYQSDAGPSYRAIYDLANLDTSYYIIPTGQSGHLLSRHYGDLAPKWRDGHFIQIPTSPEVIAERAIGTLTLTPGR